MTSETAGSSAPPRRLLWALAAILFLAAAYFYQDAGWNGNSRLDLVRAVVEQGSFRIDAFQTDPNWATEDRALYKGHYYSDKAIGSSLLAAPIYFILYKISALLGVTLGSDFVKHVLTVAVLGTAFVVGGLSMYLVAYKILLKTWESLVPTLALSLGTMLWPYSAVFYGHVIAAALLILAFYLIFSQRERPESISPGRFTGIGATMGLAFITENTSALIILGLLLYILIMLRKLGPAKLLVSAALGGLGALLPLGVMTAYNLAVYGNALASGYTFEAENRFQEGMSLGLMGIHLPSPSSTFHITVDPQFGLFWQSPVLVLGLLGILFALATPRYRIEGLVCLYSVGAMIAMNGGYYLWWGGNAFGPRLLIPALPFFIVPLALIPQSLSWATGVLGALSAVHMLIPLVGSIQPPLVFRVHRGTFYILDAPFHGFSLLYNYGIPQILKQYSEGKPSWTLGAELGLPYWLSLPALVAAEAAMILGFRRTARLYDHSASHGPGAGSSIRSAAPESSPTEN